MANKLEKFNVNGVDYELDLSTAGKVASQNGVEHTIKVKNDGELYTYSGDVDPQETQGIPLTPQATNPTDKLVNAAYYRMYINSFYCGGENSDEHTINPCSHHFIELANLTGKDFNLDGSSIQYAKTGTNWAVLPLKGVIKNGGTFLIRGAQCGVYKHAKIKVDKYDMEWRVDENGDYDENGTPIKFSDESAKFYFRISTDKYTYPNPFNFSQTTGIVENLYVDFVGAQASTSTPVDGYEKNPRTGLSSKRLFKQYYSMDPVKQATKDLSNRDDSNWWNWVDLSKEDGDVIPSIEGFRPMATFEGKDIFTSKTKFFDYKPTVITCSFGIRATDSQEYYTEEDQIPSGKEVGDLKSGIGATRCFNWLSKDIYDEFVWVRRSGSLSWGEPIESFKNETGVRSVYNRKSREYADGNVITAHKVILKNLSAGEYEYVAGHKNKENAPKMDACTPIRKFIVRKSSDVDTNGFSFVQTSDQQGFNWDEYFVWEAASKTIMDEDSNNKIQFMINTGDIAQNGNRPSEWIDYFNGKYGRMNDLEEMATIGNNDLSPKDLYKLGDGEDECKKSLENYEMFFVAEIDEENPPIFSVGSVEYFIPSLYSFNYGNTHFMCMNTEIKQTAECAPIVTKDIYEAPYNFSSYGNFYPLIKQWCETDIQRNSGKKWNIAFCHEMPFTIITTGVTNNPVVETAKQRKGSSANWNLPNESQYYWFSEFCQTHGYKLMIGGHKHTQSASWPMLENVSYNGNERSVECYRPIIVLSSDPVKFAEQIAEFKLSDSQIPNSLVPVTIDGKVRKYPNTWVENGSIVDAATGKTYFCEFETEDNLPSGTSPVTYSMSQATAYKHTSNKELPSEGIPWLKYSFGTAKNDTKPKAGQKFPFYTIWTVNNEKIEGDIRKVYGILNNGGTFDVNTDGEYVREGYSAVEKNWVTKVHSINGFGNADGHTIIEVK